ncbi:MAG: DUF695 domain-containing protein [Muribaculaceae bacterium]|nr:DUF695 domain-containing protein [Muribaculaceae bacterium]
MAIESGSWWTAPTESESGRLIMVTGRKDIDNFRSNERFKIRIEVTWKYEGDENGMPDTATSQLMEVAQNALQNEFHKDPVAVLTGIFTGDDQRDWIFYATSTHIFGKKINKALADFPQLPISIYAENDPEWQEYDEMSEAEIQ